MGSKCYAQFDPAVIEQVRQIDLFSYLQRYEPGNLKCVAGNVYCTRGHGSEDFQRQMVLVVKGIVAISPLII